MIAVWSDGHHFFPSLVFLIPLLIWRLGIGRGGSDDGDQRAGSAPGCSAPAVLRQSEADFESQRENRRVPAKRRDSAGGGRGRSRQNSFHGNRVHFIYCIWETSVVYITVIFLSLFLCLFLSGCFGSCTPKPRQEETTRLWCHILLYSC